MQDIEVALEPFGPFDAEDQGDGAVALGLLEIGGGGDAGQLRGGLEVGKRLLVALEIRSAERVRHAAAAPGCW